MRVALVDRPIDVAALMSEVADDSCGALTVFLGCVRNINDGKAVTGIEYSAYRGMAEREIGAITREAADRFGEPGS
jgi:molybdopterin synthase catalytic subunit